MKIYPKEFNRINKMFLFFTLFLINLFIQLPFVYLLSRLYVYEMILKRIGMEIEMHNKKKLNVSRTPKQIHFLSCDFDNCSRFIFSLVFIFRFLFYIYIYFDGMSNENEWGIIISIYLAFHRINSPSMAINSCVWCVCVCVYNMFAQVYQNIVYYLRFRSNDDC